MKSRSPSVKNVMSALPAVQAALREEIASRIAAGEVIVSEDSDGIRQSLAKRRQQLDAAQTERKAAARKSAA